MNDWAYTIIGTFFLIICCLAFALLALLVCRLFEGKLAVAGKISQLFNSRKLSFWLVVFLSLAFVMRLVFASSFEGHNDITFFRYWAVKLQENPFSYYDDFPTNSYLPGYLYILYLTGLAARILGMSYFSNLFLVMLKLPSVACDLLCAYLIFRIARRYVKPGRALAFFLLYAFNPATFIISSFWGQVDAFTALFTILAVNYALEKKYIGSFVSIGAGLAFKLQFAFILPVVGALVLKDAVLAAKGKDYRPLKKMAVGLACMAGAFILITLPFTINYIIGGQPLFILKVYLGQVDTFNYFSVNAFNFYSMIQTSWVAIPDTLLLGFINYNALNYIVIALLSILCMILMWRAKEKDSVYMICALLVLSVFTFSMKMHERYVFAALPLLLLAAAATKNRKVLAAAAAFSLLSFLNCGMLIFNGRQYFYTDELALFVFSNVWVYCFIYFAIVAAYIALKGRRAKEHAAANMATAVSAEKAQNAGGRLSALNENSASGGEDNAEDSEHDSKELLTGEIEKKNAHYDRLYEKKLESRKESRLGKKDFIIMAVFFLGYLALNMINLGGTVVPQTFWEVDENEYVVLEIPEGVSVGEVWAYKGIDKTESTNIIRVYAADEGDYSSLVKSSNLMGMRSISNNGDNNGAAAMYRWFSVASLNRHYRFVAFTCGKNARINEIVLLEEGTRKPIDYTVAYATSEGALNAFDERDTFPGHPSLMTDMYFDEIYHARTAFEHIMGWRPYEITHPPLGKIIISFGIRLFGMNPFGWRISGVIFSCLLLPVIYAMGRLLFKKRGWASLLAFLFALDGLHFVQGRIATIDTYSVFFSSLSMLFMIKFFRTNLLRDKPAVCLIPFALSGIIFGFSIASKWTGVYAGAGLFVLFVIYVVKTVDEYRYRAAAMEDSGVLREYSRLFDKRLAALFACGVAFFVVVPFVIYLLSYIPYLMGEKSLGALLKVMADNQVYMFMYHGKWVVGSTHQCESAWYTWPLNYRSVFMYAADGSFDKYARIHSMGNHAISWFGIAAMAFVAWRVLDKPVKWVLNLLTLEKREAYLEKHGETPQEELDKKFKLKKFRPLKFREKDILLFVLVGFFSAFLPWTLVERSTFIYHFYPSMPYVCAMIVYLLMSVCKKRDKVVRNISLLGREVAVTEGMLITGAFAFVALLFFALLFPVFAGIPVSYGYAVVFRWLGLLGGHVGF